MIKFVQCIRRNPELSVAEFRAFWREYRAMFQQVAETVDAVRCTESMTLAVSQNLDVMLSRGTQAPFDALAEIWMTNAASLDEYARSQIFQDLLSELRSMQEKFIDLENSSFFFTSEDVLVGR